MSPTENKTRPRWRGAPVVGVSGGVAVGKSTVARMLAGREGEVIEADRVGHRVITPRRIAWRELIEAFGTEIKLADGSIDRRRLGAIIFKDARKRRLLNSIVHPRLLRELGREVSRARRHSSLVVVDAALLVEWNWHDRLDVLVVVDAPRRLQLERLRKIGFSSREARERIGSQLDRSAKRAAADLVVVNDGDRRLLRRRVERLRQEVDAWLKRDRGLAPHAGRA